MEEVIKLKNPHVVRIFISSPFNGMEQERDILTKFYWPKIESALSAKGLHLKLVDMRWGITSSFSSASQTVNICLKEIDRSDIFVGLFGQRYGWNGREDPDLQENFDKAAELYPWVDHNRDRSVTEVEFLHGHLNKPGNMPACFCFRNKTYDEQKAKEAKAAGDTKKERSFQAENEASKRKLDELKERVKATEDKTLGVSMEYGEPQEAVDFIYTKVWGYVQSKIIAKIEKPMSKKEKVTWTHQAFQNSQCGLHVGSERYFHALDEYVNDTEAKGIPLTVIGQTGSGKTSLLCNWLREKNSSDNPKLLLYRHFVGAESESLKPLYIMTRLIDFVMNALSGGEFDYESKKKTNQIVSKLSETLAQMQSEEHQEKQLIIVIDNIEKVHRKKTSMPLYWLPKDFPSNVKLILSLAEEGDGIEELMEILADTHKTKKLSLEPLAKGEKEQLCHHLLIENSKWMDSEQLDIITQSTKTNNPFFLKILINELCIAGRFRKLTQQITELLESVDAVGLLVKVIKRIEEDYATTEYDGNVVEEVMCALCLCQRGISESEFPMSQQIWAPVIYAIKSFLIDKGNNTLGFNFNDMNQAVNQVYMPTEERKHAVAEKSSDIFYQIYQQCVRKDEKITPRIAVELTHLLKLSNNKVEMKRVLSDFRIFECLYAFNVFALNEYWQWLNVPSETIANLYLRSLDAYTVEQYNYHVEMGTLDNWTKVTNRKSNTLSDIRRWFEDSKHHKGTGCLLDTELELDSRRQGLSEMKRREYICVVKYQKACYLSDTERYDDALKLHFEVLEMRKQLVAQKGMDEEDIAHSYHGIGLCYFNLKDYDESEKWYNKSLELQKDGQRQTDVANTYCNLGLIYLNRNKLDDAIQWFTRANDIRYKHEPNVLSLEVSYNFHNIGLAYRKKKDYDNAEKFYVKSLKIKENLLGYNSHDVALSMMNLGSLEVYRKNYEKSLEYALKSFNVFKVVALEDSWKTMQAQENLANQYTMLKRYEEAEPHHKKIFAYLMNKHGSLDNGLGPLHRRMAKWYLENDNYERAAEISAALLASKKGKATDYAVLALADDGLPPEKKTNRPNLVTLETGLQKYPENKDVLMVKFDILIRRTPSMLMPFAVKYCETDEYSLIKDKSVEERYSLIADIIKEENEELDHAIEFLEMATKDNPGRKELLTKLEEFKAYKSPMKELTAKETKENAT